MAKKKLKEREIATELRLQGLTYDEIIAHLETLDMSVTRACLSKWFSKMRLPKEARIRLAKRWVAARDRILTEGRQKLREKWENGRNK